MSLKSLDLVRGNRGVSEKHGAQLQIALNGNFPRLFVVLFGHAKSAGSESRVFGLES